MPRLLVAVLAFSAVTLPAGAEQMRSGLPTIYSTPTVREDRRCSAGTPGTDLLDRRGTPLVRLCTAEYRACLMEGGCRIQRRDGSTLNVSFIGRNARLGRYVFDVVNQSRCPHGYGFGRKAGGGFQESCLDPYFSVGADPDAHVTGEVIFVPKLVGVMLPTGEVHDGFLVIRDTGREMRDHGTDKFAFFTGDQNDRDPANPFVQQMLDNIDFRFDYRMATEEESRQTRTRRNFPGLPNRSTGGTSR